MAGFNSSISGTQSGAKLSGSDGVTSSRQAGLTRKSGAENEAQAIPNDIGDTTTAFNDARIESKPVDPKRKHYSLMTQFIMGLADEKPSYWKSEPSAEIA